MWLHYMRRETGSEGSALQADEGRSQAPAQSPALQILPYCCRKARLSSLPAGNSAPGAAGPSGVAVGGGFSKLEADSEAMAPLWEWRLRDSTHWQPPYQGWGTEVLPNKSSLEPHLSLQAPEVSGGPCSQAAGSRAGLLHSNAPEAGMTASGSPAPSLEKE